MLRFTLSLLSVLGFFLLLVGGVAIMDTIAYSHGEILLFTWPIVIGVMAVWALTIYEFTRTKPEKEDRYSPKGRIHFGTDLRCDRQIEAITTSEWAAKFLKLDRPA